MADSPEGSGTQNLGAGQPKKKRGKLLFLVPILLVLVVATAAAYHQQLGPFGPKDAESKVEEVLPLQSLDFGSIVVNLADRPGNRFFRIVLVLEFANTGTVEKEIGERQHRIRDGLVFLLRQETIAGLQAPDAEDRLREKIRVEINRHLEKGEIQSVYFTEFIIQ